MESERNFELNDQSQIARRQEEIAPLARDRPVNPPNPVAVFNIEITNRCPLKCVMCARTHDMTREQGLMDFALFRKIIDELAQVNPGWSKEVPVRLHGFGESLVHPQFDTFIRYAEQHGVRVCLSINPIMLTADVAERLLLSAPTLLYIALDGHDDRTFAQIRGLPEAYERSVANLLSFLEAKQLLGASTRIVLSMIDFFLNHQSIELMRSRWADVPGIDEIRIKPFCTWDGNSSTVNQMIQLDRQPVVAAPQDQPVTCSWPWMSVTVLWDGTVVPCCLDFDKRYVLGNVTGETLMEIWAGDRMQRLRQEFITGDVTNPLCTNCESLRA